jgi:hypothetical protein
MHPIALLRYLLLPLRFQPLFLIVVFAVLITAAEVNGLWGLPVVVILGSWFFKYAFAILDEVIHGRRDPPVLSFEMTNPFEQRPLGLFFILATFYTLTDALHPWLNDQAITALRAVLLSIVPAMIASIAANGRIRDAFDPGAVFGTIARIPFAYAILLVSIGTLWFFAAWALKSAPFSFSDLWRKENFLPGQIVTAIGVNGLLSSMVRLMMLMYLWFATFACIGGTIYERRRELDFDAAASPERIAARKNRELEKERDKVMDRIFAEVRGGAFTNAGDQVRRLIEQAPDPLEEGRWLYARAAAAVDQGLAEFIAQLLLDRLLKLRPTGESLTILRERLAVNAGFKATTAGRTLQWAQLARDAGDRGAARKLLTNFDDRYPNDPMKEVAARLQIELQR